MEQYSDRTKRRKLAASVKRIVYEAANSVDAEHCDFVHPTCDASAVTKTDSLASSVSCTIDDGNGNTNSSSDSEINDKNFEKTAEFIDCDTWTARDIGDCESDMDSDDTGNSVEPNDDDDASLPVKLSKWATKFGITLAALTSPLLILRPCVPSLPKDSNTIMRTPQQCDVQTFAGGEYHYFSVKFWLRMLLQNTGVNSVIEQLTLHINIDGIPLFRSSCTALWPILCSVKELSGSIFPVDVYCSNHKPTSLDDFLGDFITEVNILQQCGYVDDNGRIYKVVLEAAICDAPARSYLKCIKGHSGYDCCERCVQTGDWCSGRIVLPNLTAPLRTDEDFMMKSDARHHCGVSPFCSLSFGMVTAFPLDYMHMVCLGVVRRLLNLWVNGPKTCRLPHVSLTAISGRLLALKLHIPREFSRKPRSVHEFKLWKATELRLFLLYSGPVVLKGLVEPKYYSNFMDLSVAVRILLCPKLLKHYMNYARELLVYFVETFGKLYGKEQLVYNVHSLIHLPDDAQNFGVLDNISAFKYESYLGKLKKLVRRPQKPCAQIVRRISEGFGRATSADSENSRLVFRKPHMEGPVTVSLSVCQQYKQYNGRHCFISTGQGDNCFMVGNKVGLVRNILKETVDHSAWHGYAIFEEFAIAQAFFDNPLMSTRIGIHYVSKLSGTRTPIPLSDLETKCVLLPFKAGYIAISELHL